MFVHLPENDKRGTSATTLCLPFLSPRLGLGELNRGDEYGKFGVSERV